MALAYHISEDDGLITVRADEEVSLVEARELGIQLIREADFDPALPHLVDLRGADLAPDGCDLTDFIDFVTRDYGPSVKASIAIVVDQNLDPERMASIYWLSCALDHAELFDDYEHALRWLISREFRTVDAPADRSHLH